MSKITYSVFTKAWRDMPLPELAKHVKALGFDAIELPVRPKFQVTPDRVGTDLPAAGRIMADHGVSIASISGPLDEPTFAAMAEAGVGINRLCEYTGGQKYLEAEAKIIAKYQALVPLLEQYHVTIGVQNHCDDYIANATQMRRVCAPFDRRHVAAVWDQCHCALNGEVPEQAIDIVWDRLCMVNLKNAYWRRKNGLEAEVAQWEVYWTSGRQGLACWPKVVEELKKRDFSGLVCLTNEYSDEASGNRLIAEDMAFAKSLFA